MNDFTSGYMPEPIHEQDGCDLSFEDILTLCRVEANLQDAIGVIQRVYGSDDVYSLAAIAFAAMLSDLLAMNCTEDATRQATAVLNGERTILEVAFVTADPGSA